MLVCPACGGTSHRALGDSWFECTSQVVIDVVRSPYDPVGKRVFGDCRRKFSAVEAEAEEMRANAAADREADRSRALYEREPCADDLNGHMALEQSLGRYERQVRSEFVSSSGKGIKASIRDLDDARALISNVLTQAVSKVEPRLIATAQAPPKGRRSSGKSKVPDPDEVFGWVFPIRYASRDPRPIHTGTIGIGCTIGGRVLLISAKFRRSATTYGVSSMIAPYFGSRGGSLDGNIGPMFNKRDLEKDLRTIATHCARCIGSFLVNAEELKSSIGHPEYEAFWTDSAIPLRSESGGDFHNRHGGFIGRYANWPAIIMEIPRTLEFPGRDTSAV